METKKLEAPKPLKARVICFSVPIRRKMANGLLYQVNDKRGSMSRAEDIWILSNGPECKTPMAPGTRCLISDGFELYEEDLKLWDDYKDRPEFAGLRQFVADVEGTVRTQVVFEGSIIAVHEE